MKYTQSNYNIGLVMHLLNHSSEAMTLIYVGLDQAIPQGETAKRLYGLGPLSD